MNTAKNSVSLNAQAEETSLVFRNCNFYFFITSELLVMKNYCLGLSYILVVTVIAIPLMMMIYRLLHFWLTKNAKCQ